MFPLLLPQPAEQFITHFQGFKCKPGLHNIRPAGQMRSTRSFLAARENSVAENVAKARLRIITCPYRISSTLWRNRLLRPVASLCWSIWPFELSELCRPGVSGCSTRRACFQRSASLHTTVGKVYSNCIHFCSHITWSSNSNMNIVEWLVSMPVSSEISDFRPSAHAQSDFLDQKIFLWLTL